ncbi:carboxymuconolactone decarboxylase family protein [Kibdelosporangium philippinense]|uniref:Carboxymuconolactone decarboxylase family protein n=2 Tax=Kibdelosporangium philippinense TaxID=211113 RepID=A0ABS8Z211_9PSEU|nr:carboxymuconolactone decarboxylase family protein [Kibdelosporangium philippinense]MCE7001964.1 carboxymuconolactone decarboxylase family protein [Kibdelosporangium philippinense]
MRLEPIPADKLGEDNRALDARIRAVVDRGLPGFTSVDEDGALLGPFPAFLHFPKFGEPLFGWSEALFTDSALTPRVREVVILTIGARLNAAFELYAHSRVGRSVGLPATAVADLVVGQRPVELSREELVAHDVATALYQGRPLPGENYAEAVAAFGETGVAELVHLAAHYVAISMLLNAYTVPVPPDGI